MENKLVDNLKSKTTNSLMAKKKVELIEIILRKDDVEKKLKGEKESLEKRISFLNEHNDHVTEELERLNAEVKAVKERNVCIENEHKRLNNMYETEHNLSQELMKSIDDLTTDKEVLTINNKRLMVLLSISIVIITGLICCLCL